MDDARASNMLTELWVEHRNAVAAFVYRRATPAMVDDVVAETFLVAWRRITEVPPDARPWLLATARNVLTTHLRAQGRQQALKIRAAREPGTPAFSAEEIATDRASLTWAWQLLSEREREILAIAGWERLTSGQAATVLGCSRSAYSVRLLRARRHLIRLLQDLPSATALRPADDVGTASTRSAP